MAGAGFPFFFLLRDSFRDGGVRSLTARTRIVLMVLVSTSVKPIFAVCLDESEDNDKIGRCYEEKGEEGGSHWIYEEGSGKRAKGSWWGVLTQGLQGARGGRWGSGRWCVSTEWGCASGEFQVGELPLPVPSGALVRPDECQLWDLLGEARDLEDLISHLSRLCQPVFVSLFIFFISFFIFLSIFFLLFILFFIYFFSFKFFF